MQQYCITSFKILDDNVSEVPETELQNKQVGKETDTVEEIKQGTRPKHRSKPIQDRCTLS